MRTESALQTHRTEFHTPKAVFGTHASTSKTLTRKATLQDKRNASRSLGEKMIEEWEYRRELAIAFREAMRVIERASGLGGVVFPEGGGLDLIEARDVLRLIEKHLEKAKEALEPLQETSDEQ